MFCALCQLTGAGVSVRRGGLRSSTQIRHSQPKNGGLRIGGLHVRNWLVGHFGQFCNSKQLDEGLWDVPLGMDVFLTVFAVRTATF